MIFTLSLLLLLGLYGASEYRRHQRNIDRIPKRILVNGTRGKSSVTRLITGGLQGGGIRTLGKTTGTSPRLIYPDGSEVHIVRAGKANIIEQLMVFRKAVAAGVEAIVTECMAVLPPNQKIMQNQLVRSTVGVITNVRADHLDEMGPTVEDVARALSYTVPANGILFTCERERLPILEEAGAAKSAQVVCVTPEQITDEIMHGFTYLEHKDNVALALAVCQHMGVSRDAALRGMYAVNPDPGVLRIFKVHHYEKHIEFVNAFAANDPDSYVLIWDSMQPFFTPGKKRIVIVNCRQDRIQRTESLAALITERLPADHFILAGEYTLALYNKAMGRGFPSSRISNLGGASADVIFQRVAELTPEYAIAIGVGNIVGFGEEITRMFTTRGKEIVY